MSVRGGIGSHTKPYRGAHDEWLTPPEIIDALGPFDLDPRSPVSRPWPTAAAHFTEFDNGLGMPWAGRVWLNPPYGPQTGLWLDKLARHGDGIALTFARTETEIFHEHVWAKATALLFLRGRLHFYRVDGTRAAENAGGPSVLIAYGDVNALRLAESPIPGAYVRVIARRAERTAGTNR